MSVRVFKEKIKSKTKETVEPVEETAAPDVTDITEDADDLCCAIDELLDEAAEEAKVDLQLAAKHIHHESCGCGPGWWEEVEPGERSMELIPYDDIKDDLGFHDPDDSRYTDELVARNGEWVD